MELLSDNKKPLVYLGSVHKESKKGTNYVMLKFGDKETYSNFEFFKPDGIDENLLVTGAYYVIKCLLEIRGYNQVLRLDDVIYVEG